MNMATPPFFPTRLVYIFAFVSFIGSGSFLIAEDNIQTVSSPKTRTVVADLLMVDGDLYIIRGEHGEIQIEVTPDTRLSEKFAFGDRIKAVLLPNDVAQIITRAAPDEPVGITSGDVPETPPLPPLTETSQPAEAAPAQVTQTPNVRVIIADLLMVDGSFYIVRSEYGEIQIEITPNTDLSEDFKFGDKIKARVTSADKALSVVRAGKDEPTGVQEETAPIPSSAPTPPVPSTPTTKPTPSKQETPEPPSPEIPSTRIIVADVLMVEGDFYIVRGERGEIRIEVTPKTTISESFDYGDRIKAEVLPNDKALTIERAGPNDPIGVTTP
jgi:exosome complex RNA-binding protein Csl4